MKQFSCSDVVPGCGRTFTGTEQEILSEVGAHAAADHGLSVVPPEMIDLVRSHLVAA